MTVRPDCQVRHLQDFEGVWEIDRQVLHRSGEAAQVTGRAEFLPDGDGLLYREEGQMQLRGGPAMTAVRRYHWRPGMEVFFEDGRYFHTVPPSGGATTHRCDPDTYDVRYDFRDWPVWTTVWTVQGPRKDYRMLTRYRPLRTAR